MENTDNTVTLTAVGDILLHGRVYGGTNKKKGYNFLNQFKNVSGLLGNSDLTVANLETIIAGKELGLSSFPKFNAPEDIGYALKEMGVDLVSIANNHVLDRGEEGLLRSIENLEKIGLEYDGAYKSEDDKDRLRIFEKNGLKVCFISYTRGTNGIKIPSDKLYLVNSLKKTSVLNISKEIRKIKSDNLADVVIVNMHFGEEYHLSPSSEQREIAASIADAGADVIIGHHSHVLQPPEWLETSYGTKSLVAYSLGNFISGQNGLHRQIGGALHLKISKPDPDYKGIVVSNPKYDLTFVEREERLRYGIHLFRDWVKDNEYIITDHGKFPAKEVYTEVQNRLRKEINDLEIN
ncbi:CapA family protein [Virgibacillus sp. NKC19-16]|nr:CapA family protein [Virgibacillus sp. NKC19-16]